MKSGLSLLFIYFISSSNFAVTFILLRPTFILLDLISSQMFLRWWSHSSTSQSMFGKVCMNGNVCEVVQRGQKVEQIHKTSFQHSAGDSCRFSLTFPIRTQNMNYTVARHCLSHTFNTVEPFSLNKELNLSCFL